MTFTSVLEKLTQRLPLTGEDFVFLLTGLTPGEEQQLYAAARSTAQRQFGNRIFIRGLIEISNLCKNDCYYCDIRTLWSVIEQRAHHARRDRKIILL